MGKGYGEECEDTGMELHQREENGRTAEREEACVGSKSSRMQEIGSSYDAIDYDELRN